MSQQGISRVSKALKQSRALRGKDEIDLYSNKKMQAEIEADKEMEDFIDDADEDYEIESSEEEELSSEEEEDQPYKKVVYYYDKNKKQKTLEEAEKELSDLQVYIAELKKNNPQPAEKNLTQGSDGKSDTVSKKESNQ